MFIPLTPLRFLHRAVDLYGNKAGIVSGDRTFTYREFGDRCRRLASGLECLGVQPGDRVAYLSFNNHQLLEGYFGVIQAKAVVMPLNVRLSPAELGAILCHSGARILIFEPDFAPIVEKLRSACPLLEHCVSVEGGYEELLAEGRPEPADILAYDENAPAELFYTSGSTGTPKGVLISNRTLYLHALDVLADIPLDDTSVELHTIPLFHANGWGRPQIATLKGATQVMVRRFEPANVCRLIQEHRVTTLSMVPTMATALLNVPNLAQYDFSSLRLVMLGGAAASPLLIERLEKALGCRAIAGYGLSETAPIITAGKSKCTVVPASVATACRRCCGSSR